MLVLSCPLQIAFLFSIVFAIMDLKERAVSVKVFFLYFLSGTVMAIHAGRGITDILLSSAPGMAFLVFSHFSGGRLGGGDALYFILTALFLRFGQVMFVVLFSLFSAALASLFLIFAGRTKPLPFLAFMPGTLLLLMIGVS